MFDLEKDLHDVVSDVITVNREESIQAEKMLEPVNEPPWAACLVRVGGKEFYIITKEGTYHYDLQYYIEKKEKQTFRELGWDDLSYRNIIYLREEETTEVVIENDGYYNSLYDYVLTCTEPYVVQSSICITNSLL